MLEYRHQLDVGVTVLFEIGDEQRGQLAVCVKRTGIGVVGLFPRTGVDFVYVDGTGLGAGDALHIRAVAEAVGGAIVDDGGRLRPQIGEEAVGIGVVDETARFVVDAVFVAHAGRGVIDCAGPEIAVVHALHGRLLPVVHIADDADSFGIGRVGAEGHAAALDVRAEVCVGVKCIARIEIVKIHALTSKKMDRSCFLYYGRL